MPEIVVRDSLDRKRACSMIMGRNKTPFTVTITDGRHRTIEQNKTQFMWFKEIAEHYGDRTAEEVRAEAKLRFGVPILRANHESFRTKYDRLIKPRSYEEKLELMIDPFNFPITSLMNVSEKTEYLDTMFKFYTEQGVMLTVPPEKL